MEAYCRKNGYEPILIAVRRFVEYHPHYQEIKDDVLDGMKVFEDIAYPDSMGKTFYAIPDGTYLFIDDCVEELRGEAYRIKDGVMTEISTGSGSLYL